MLVERLQPVNEVVVQNEWFALHQVESEQRGDCTGGFGGRVDAPPGQMSRILYVGTSEFPQGCDARSVHSICRTAVPSTSLRGQVDWEVIEAGQLPIAWERPSGDHGAYYYGISI